MISVQDTPESFGQFLGLEVHLDDKLESGITVEAAKDLL